MSAKKCQKIVRSRTTLWRHKKNHCNSKEDAKALSESLGSKDIEIIQITIMRLINTLIATIGRSPNKQTR